MSLQEHAFLFLSGVAGSNLRKSKCICKALSNLITRILWLSTCLLIYEHIIWLLLEFWQRRFYGTKFLVLSERELEADDNSLSSRPQCSCATSYQSLPVGCVCLNGESVIINE
jgi:hypothetical protein